MSQRKSPGTMIEYTNASGEHEVLRAHLFFTGATQHRTRIRLSRHDENVPPSECFCAQFQASPEEILTGEPDPRFQAMGECCGVHHFDEEEDDDALPNHHAPAMSRPRLRVVQTYLAADFGRIPKVVFAETAPSNLDTRAFSGSARVKLPIRVPATYTTQRRTINGKKVIVKRLAQETHVSMWQKAKKRQRRRLADKPHKSGQLTIRGALVTE